MTVNANEAPFVDVLRLIVFVIGDVVTVKSLDSPVVAPTPFLTLMVHAIVDKARGTDAKLHDNTDAVVGTPYTTVLTPLPWMARAFDDRTVLMVKVKWSDTGVAVKPNDEPLLIAVTVTDVASVVEAL